MRSCTFRHAAVGVVLLMAHRAQAQSAMERTGDATSIAVSRISAVALGPERFATAVRTTAGTMRIDAWQLTTQGGVMSLGSVAAGRTDRIATAQLGRDRFITAIRTESGSLKLIAWRVPALGALMRSGEAEAGRIEDVAIIAVSRTVAVTAVIDGNSELKLISWSVDSTSGAITRLRDAGFGKATRPQLAVLEWRRMVVATRAPSGGLLLRALSIDDAGIFQSHSTISGPLVSEFALSPLSVERVTTAARRSTDGTLVVTTWNVTRDGTLSQRSEANAGQTTSIALTTRGTAHAIVAARQSDGTMRLITWDAIAALTRLGSIDAGAIAQVAVVTLGTDRIVTAVQGASGEMKVIAWRDRAVTLLRGEWGPARPMFRPVREFSVESRAPHAEIETVSQRPGIAPPRPRPGGARPGDLGWTPQTDSMEPRKADADSPPLIGSAIRTGVNSAAYDPMIAVGHQFVMVSQDHELAFFDRNGVRLSPKRDEAVQLSSNAFFGTFIANENSDGTPNEQNINRHIGTGAWVRDCDPTTASIPCIVEFYDTRVVYDRTSRRFIVVSGARAGLYFEKESVTTENDPAVRRYFAIAISKTEDPRDGFWQYMTTESNYADWPRVIAQHGVVVMAHNDNTTDTWREGPTPRAYVFVTDSLGAGLPHPPSRKLYASETGENVVPVANFGTIAGNWTSLTRTDGDVLHLYSFQTFASLASPAGLSHTSVNLGAALPGKRNVFDVRRDDKLYFAGVVQVTPMLANVAPARYSVRVVRVPLLLGTGGKPAPLVLGNGVLDRYFGRSAPGDAASDLVSYEVPSVAVTKDGHMVFVYGRIGVATATPLFPEARYSVYYADARGLRRSRLLQAGEWLPTAFYNQQATLRTVTPFFDGPRKLDHTSATVDPVDDQTVWMAGAFADAERQNGWDSSCVGGDKAKRCARWSSMVIGRVKP